MELSPLLSDKSILAVFIAVLLLAQASFAGSVRYTPDWESLDSRPLPAWYDQDKIGIFLHWGVFSVPSFVNAWFWYWWKGPQPHLDIVTYMKQNYRPDFTYADFAKEFTTEFFDPYRWAEIFNASGARYVVQVTKHHEGFTSWPSKYSWNWNAGDVGPNRDLVEELSTAIRKKTNLRYGVYHSLFEWFNPLFLKDKANNFTTQDFVLSKTLPELYELVNKYKPDVVWSDGSGNTIDTYWNSKQFIAWLYNDSPVKDTVVTNDRWGTNCGCKHGGFLTCGDRYNPKKKQNRKWENAMTIDRKAWTFRRNAQLSDFLTVEELLAEIIQTVSCGGNILINVGPTKEGTIAPIFEERLRQMGSWLRVNGEAIYGTSPWTHQNDTLHPNVWYTTRKETPGTVYALVLKWPSNLQLPLGAPTPTDSTSVTLLGYNEDIPWEGLLKAPGIIILPPALSVQEIPCLWAWVFKITNIKME
ncbi:alpha-L-fucosidase-like [Littorina saxatilis]|uniref:alpha-L-fucosidase n=1 Tax=Littorina saxatilis TaxID=31220 RepID=A0AAN9APJ2_9CAEN